MKITKQMQSGYKEFLERRQLAGLTDPVSPEEWLKWVQSSPRIRGALQMPDNKPMLPFPDTLD